MHNTPSTRRFTVSLALAALVFMARPVFAQATYEYVGNPFTLYSCGLSSSGTGTALCTTPGPNATTSYTATDHVEATLVLDTALPADMVLTDVRTFPGFSLTMSDGQHTVTNLQQVGMFALVSTDANGDILQWRLVINTGGTDNGGIATQNAQFVTDSGTLKCCDPVPGGDLARNSGVAGVWTSGTGTPTPQSAINNLITVVGDPLLGLTNGQVQSLTDKLNNALASIQAGFDKQAANQLKSFLSAVDSAVKSGKMSPQTGLTLTNAANAILALL
jgi:hypothetical protein